MVVCHCVLSKGCMSLNDESFVPIRQQYLYDYYTINTLQSICHHNNTTLKGSFLKFCGSPEIRQFKIHKFIPKKRYIFGSPEKLYFLSNDILGQYPLSKEKVQSLKYIFLKEHIKQMLYLR